MLKLLCIFIGGGLGSICRYSVGAYLIQSSQGRIPWATFAANALGCLLIGILIGYFERVHTNWLYMLLVTGFLWWIYDLFHIFKRKHSTDATRTLHNSF